MAQSFLENNVRSLLSEHGVVRAQPGSDWTGAMPIPQPLATYYQLIGPVDIEIPSYGDGFLLPSLSKLWAFQAGYRWDGNTGAVAPDWEHDWIVVAHQGGDPFIFSIAGEEVLFAQHGVGRWTPTPVFSNVTSMAGCLATLGHIVRENRGTFVDSDGMIGRRHLEAAQAAISEFLRSPLDAEGFLTLLGWI